MPAKKNREVWIVSVRMTSTILAGMVSAVYTNQQAAIDHCTDFNQMYQERTKKDDYPYYYENKPVKEQY